MFLSLNAVAILAQSLSQSENPSATTGSQDETQLLQLTTSIAKERYCSDIGSRFLRWKLILKYTNTSTRNILIDKKSSWIYRSMVSRNPKAAAARRYEYDPSASYADLSKLGFRNTPEADSFVVLKPGESFRLETDFRVHLYDGTKDSRDFLHPGNHILEVRVATWYYYAEPRIYRERWIDKGYLWFQNVTSLPMPFTVERNPVVTPCAD